MHINRLGEGIKKELVVMFRLRLFFIAVVGIVLLCLLSFCYHGTNGRGYMILEILLAQNRVDFIRNHNISRECMLQLGIGTWTRIMLPMLLGLGMANSVAEITNSQINIFLYPRSKKALLCIAKTMATMVYGGTTMVAGYGLFAVVVILANPLAENEIVVMETVYRTMGLFFYGASIAWLSYAVSLLWKDRYLLLCMPVLIKYIYEQVINKGVTDAMMAANDKGIEAWERWRFESVLDMPRGLWNVGMIVVAFLAVGYVYFVMLKRNSDRVYGK